MLIKNDICKFISNLADLTDVSRRTNYECECKREKRSDKDQTKVIKDQTKAEKDQAKIKQRSNKVEQMVCVDTREKKDQTKIKPMVCVDAKENKDQISHSSA